METFSYLPTQIFFTEVWGKTHKIIIFLGLSFLFSIFSDSCRHWYLTIWAWVSSLQVLVSTLQAPAGHGFYLVDVAGMF